MVEKRFEKFGQGSPPPPFWANPQKKTFFFFRRASLTVFTENLTKYSLLTILSDNLKALDASASKKLTILSFPHTQLVCKQRAKCRRRTKLVERVVHGRHIGLFRGFAKETKTFLLYY